MNQYRIELYAFISKDVNIRAETPQQALEFVVKAFFNSDLVKITNDDVTHSVDFCVTSEDNAEKLHEEYVRDGIGYKTWNEWMDEISCTSASDAKASKKKTEKSE